MGGTLMRRAARALLWSVWWALATAVPLGISLLALRFVLDAAREDDKGLGLVLVIAGLLFHIWLWAVYLYFGHYWSGRASRWRAVVCCAGVVVVLASSFAAVIFGQQDVEQQILHNRGVTATGVVTGPWSTEGDHGPMEAGVHVRLGDGTTLAVEGYPRVGSTVQVTSDPLGTAHPQLGPRPAIPKRLGLKVTLAVLIVGHIMTASIILGPLDQDPVPRRLRRRRAPSDEAPVDKAPSYGLEPDS
ncbi:hypothetical protein A6P39_001315 [Streptomyces sp. FXJ1.172]|uniref:hypothetical protein n=1 Tax=Streptomyces sp. FXJ1.172 TaxID=710705 RepID=UPI0007CFDB41|nr:hypothetical protein [Streptomyces sp. FXJ1.172]WEO92859.1 hypothetical protein A6P39_001315 [Streptomyces sp. FXJ1.172]